MTNQHRRVARRQDGPRPGGRLNDAGQNDGRRIDVVHRPKAARVDLRALTDLCDYRHLSSGGHRHRLGGHQPAVRRQRRVVRHAVVRLVPRQLLRSRAPTLRGTTGRTRQARRALPAICPGYALSR